MKAATATIEFHYKQKKTTLTIGDTVTVFKTDCWGHWVGERAKFTRLTKTFAEFTTTSGSVVKIYAQCRNVCPDKQYFNGYWPAEGWRKDGWEVEPGDSRPIVLQKPTYFRFGKTDKTYGCFDR